MLIVQGRDPKLEFLRTFGAGPSHTRALPRRATSRVDRLDDGAPSPLSIVSG
jgi:hypothetical protein